MSRTASERLSELDYPTTAAGCWLMRRPDVDFAYGLGSQGPLGSLHVTVSSPWTTRRALWTSGRRVGVVCAAKGPRSRSTSEPCANSVSPRWSSGMRPALCYGGDLTSAAAR